MEGGEKGVKENHRISRQSTRRVLIFHQENEHRTRSVKEGNDELV